MATTTWPRRPKREIRTDSPKLGIPYQAEEGGFGVVYVELRPGQRRDIEVNGQHITVIREFVH